MLHRIRTVRRVSFARACVCRCAPPGTACAADMDWIAIVSGFGVGAIVGLTGVGGGSLMTPLLIGVFKLNPAVAIGTDLWFAAITKTGGAGGAPPARPRRLPHHRAAAGRQHRRRRWPTIALMHWTGRARKGWASALTFVARHRAAADRRDRGLSQAPGTRVGLQLERWMPESRKPCAHGAERRCCWACWSRSARSAPARSAPR